MYQARNTKTGEIVTLKRMRMEREKNSILVSELQEMTDIVKMNNIAVADLVLGEEQTRRLLPMKLRY